MKQHNEIEPFFITVVVEGELIAAGYVFEPPGHAGTTSLPKILTDLTDDKLTTWPRQISNGEVQRRRHVVKAFSGALHGKN